MFSVDDLLVSHGYKRSKNPTNSSENQNDEVQHEDVGRRSGQATRNGLPNHPGAIPKTNKERRYQNDNDKPVIQPRQRNVYYEDFSGPGNVQGGLYDQSQLSRSSHSKRDKDPAYWRRQGQDFSGHGYPDRVDSETKEMAAACALSEDENESQCEIEERLDNMKMNTRETMKPGDYRWQNLNRETQNQPTAFGRHEFNTDNKERLLQDVCSGRQDIVTSHIKNKAQSFPRVSPPEKSNSAEVPSLVSSKHYKVNPELETLKHSEPPTKPKYGRPLKPPSYEFHQQTRGILETNSPQDDQQKRKTTFYVTKVNEPVQDSTLGPPLYIPPPCYKSPDQQSKNQHVPEEVPDYDTYFIKEMQLLEQSICITSESSVNQLQMEEEEQILYSSKTHVRNQERRLSSVQYIPFDDPRIRHIKVIHPTDHQMDNQTGDANNTDSNVYNKNSVEQEFYNSAFDVPDSVNIAIKCNQVSGSSRWFVESSVDQDSGTLSTQKGCYDTGNNLYCESPKGQPTAESSDATELSSETLTKVKTFEPGTEVQGKNHLKKKTNETIFCLVSVPVQSELNMPDSDRNNNVTQGASENDGSEDLNQDLKEQSLLSTSSTDLELQALTGNMTNKNESQKQAFQRTEFKQIHDFKSKEPTKHKEIQHSGSWPCNRYEDKETQTSFKEEPKIQQPVDGSQSRKPNTLTSGHLLKYGSSTTESAPSSSTDNRKSRPIPPPRKALGHPYKPSKTESSKTAVLNPKPGQSVSRTSSTGLPGRRSEPSFAHKEERKSPCSVKEAFGQFLLKPVSRRPWDAISELESFNKEIQEQEEKNEEDKENEKKQERNEEEEEKGKTEEKSCRADKVSLNHRCCAKLQNIKSSIPVFKKGADKSKPESENASKSSDARVPFSDLRNVRSEEREMDKPVKEKKGNVGLKQKQENARKMIKRAIGLHPMKSNVSGCSESKNCFNPFKNIHSTEASVENRKNKDSDKMKKAAGRNIPASETASVAPLSLTKKNQGRSEPNLRSVGRNVNEGTRILDPSTKKIPSNESLQARAVRILGIEVAVESLTADNKTLPNEDSDSDDMAESNELSNKKIPWAEMKTDMASKEKHIRGWLKKTFIGENILGSMKDQNSDEETGEQQRPGLSKHHKDHAHSAKSAVLPLAERKALPSNIEKKAKSPSKVTVPKQGKVASAASRAAMDRLARMKEVDSVARMRRLRVKNAGSSEDRDEEPEEEGNDANVGRTEFPRKQSQGSCVSKRIISLNKNERLDNKTPKKNGRNLLSSEVYDPSRVERV
ncbi:junctional protein associated with coronary artery disease [Protobothrops mucrosquamatus]|uniref:junctional protein associated with coronary artery disease n=1 Tax=Protobothrops mucrosquamatus TaxID=103944 RepID=UPI000775F7FE|nr:junctional protein associated with coronary artery disease [Protobothrops mucrosquamatus]